MLTVCHKPSNSKQTFHWTINNTRRIPWATFWRRGLPAISVSKASRCRPQLLQEFWRASASSQQIISLLSLCKWYSHIQLLVRWQERQFIWWNISKYQDWKSNYGEWEQCANTNLQKEAKFSNFSLNFPKHSFTHGNLPTCSLPFPLAERHP